MMVCFNIKVIFVFPVSITWENKSHKKLIVPNILFTQNHQDVLWLVGGLFVEWDEEDY